ncbi:MAG TPA: NAD(P)/FAD-dependent oxidoreductase [Pyrinomonadaceae bacterium]|jgi:flavin-dependent dehydrogenase
MSESSDIYDVLIAGGGPAGTCAAIHLATGGARVLLVEQKKFPRAKLCGEFISPECLAHFKRLGVAERMTTAGGANLTETIFYSRRGAGVSMPSEWFGFEGGAALGLSRAEMDARLLRRAHEAGVEVLEEAQAAGLLVEGGRVRGVRVKMDERARDIRATLTIDATGRSRLLARRVEAGNRSDAAARQKRARLVAFKAHLEGARSAAGSCEIYFYRGGYGGLSRVENGVSNLCFIAAAEDVRACNGEPERVMREIVATNRRAAETLADVRVQSEWLAVALDGFGRRRLIPAPGLMAVGDAASFIDPFTGSGMLMALESGELAAGVIARHLPGLLRNGSDERLEFQALADDYRARYKERFNSRLRVCSILRRAVFVPRLAEAGIAVLNASRRVRYRLARATRRGSLKTEG